VLLDAWRGLGTPEPADSIETIGISASRRRNRRSAGKTVAAHRAWRKAAKGRRAEDLDRLLATWRDVPAAEVAARAELLREWPADPRRDRAVVALLCESPYRTTPAVWTQLCALTEMIRDVASAQLRAFVAAILTIFIGIGPPRSRAVRAVLEPRSSGSMRASRAHGGDRPRARSAELAREEQPRGGDHRDSRRRAAGVRVQNSPTTTACARSTPMR
jgi:hypothetical protein